MNTKINHITDSDAERFIVGTMLKEKGSEEKVKVIWSAFFSWICIARRLGIQLFFRRMIERYIDWLEYHSTGSLVEFLISFDVRDFVLGIIRTFRERQAFYAHTFSTALQ